VAVDGAACGRGVGPLALVVVLGEPLLEEDQLELIALFASDLVVSVATVERLGGDLAGGCVEVCRCL
jgi:hypothetical protein